jgi:hypothetical protein
MKLRHGAALALVVWYLMVPPYRICSDCSDRLQPDPPNAPLKKWETVHRFDTLTKCEENLLWYQREKNRMSFKRPRVSFIATYGKCISDDDPRLKAE